MQFLSLFTPASIPQGPPSGEHMAEMGRLIGEMTRAGVLIATGGIKSRDTGMRITRRNGKLAVENGAVAGSSLMPAAGYALLRAASREALVEHVERFLSLAGDGTAEVIELMEGPSPGT
jgi:hypothetical protein